MNKIYGKSILYAYSSLPEIAEQIDELVEKKALNSMTDYSPAFNQFEKIVDLSNQKVLILNLFDKVNEVLKKFNEHEIDCLDYKYFKKRDKSYYATFDSSSRKYFREQIKVVNKFCEKMEKVGITDGVFYKDYLSIDFFKALIKRVKELDDMSYKNKGKKQKAIKLKNIA